jgi:hypothetical protein
MRWVLVCAVLVTAALLATSWEPPRRADRTPVELQEAQRPREAIRPGSTAGETTAAETPGAGLPVDPFAVAPDHRAVQVLGADDRPAAGVAVIFRWNRKHTSKTTDERGLAHIDPEGHPARAEIGDRKVELLEPLTIMQLDTLLPVTVALMDAETGARLEWTCGASPTHVLAGQYAFVRARLDAPDGHVAFETYYAGKLARSARAASLLVPVRPEARLTLHVITADGAPAAGARIHSAEMAGRRPVFKDGPAPPRRAGEQDHEIRAGGAVLAADTAPAGADGRLHVHGIPFLQGERIGFVVVRDSRHAWVEATLPVHNDGCKAAVTLPEKPNHLAPAVDTIFGVGSGAGGSFRGRGGTAEAEILVYRRDGTPAAGVRVVLKPWNRTGRTDQQGLVRFNGLPGGTPRALVLEPGFTRAEATFSVTAAGRTRVRLDEPPGWTARVLVLDETGHPVPFARLHVSQSHGVAYMDLANGVHDLVRYTDQKGEAELARLSDGPVEIAATFGTRKAKGRAERGAGLAILRLGTES